MIAFQGERATSRDTQFAELVERQSRFVYRVAYSIVRNTQDAEDVVQDTFLKIYKRNAWEEIENERAFLARTAWRLAVARRRIGSAMNVETETMSKEMNPEAKAMAASFDTAIQRMIDTLPEDLRQPLALSGLREMNSREIAAVMGIPEGTVRTRLARARQMLKQKLAGYL
jgi:RNA polymerase sigma-70 factor (ECF subfamily)